MYDGWRVPLVCGIKWKCLAAGGIGETPRIRLFRGGSARTKANKGVIRICPFVLPSALKAMFPTLMPKKPRFISPGDHASERYISAPIKSSGVTDEIFPFFRLHDVSIGSNVVNVMRGVIHIHQLLFCDPREQRILSVLLQMCHVVSSNYTYRIIYIQVYPNISSNYIFSTIRKLNFLV